MLVILNGAAGIFRVQALIIRQCECCKAIGQYVFELPRGKMILRSPSSFATFSLFSVIFSVISVFLSEMSLLKTPGGDIIDLSSVSSEDTKSPSDSSFGQV